ncbi:MAG: MATE family efflux transporter [Candidatus Hydrogenedentes bacterium]|nr:MATE family efflux transporter [Candidatus Hydrogenedentota bacterium]
MSSDPTKPAAPEHQDRHGTDLTTGSVMRRLIGFAVPMLMGSALQTAYSIVNALWVGRGLGSNAMAALAVSFPIFFLLMAVAGGLTLASNVLVSQAYGARNIARVKQVIQNSMVLTFAVGLACPIVGHFAADTIVRAMQTPPEVLTMAESYLRVYLWSTPFMFGVYFLASVMRGVGDSKTPLRFQAISLALTAILDPILMFGWLGLPRLGLNGTAVATICAQAFSLAAIAAYIHRHDHVASPDWRRLKVDLPTTWLTLKIGAPSMLQQALVSLGMLFIVGFVNRFGAHSAAAFGIAMRIDQLAFMPAMTIGMAVSTLSGQNIGAGRYDRVAQVFLRGAALSCSMTAVASILAAGMPHTLIQMFTGDPDVIAIGVQYLRIISVGYLLFAVLFTSNGVINGSGHTLATTAITLIAFWIVRVPLAAYLSAHLGRVEGVWYAILVSIATGTTISLIYFLSGRWKIPVARNRPAPPMDPTTEVE